MRLRTSLAKIFPGRLSSILITFVSSILRDSLFEYLIILLLNELTIGLFLMCFLPIDYRDENFPSGNLVLPQENLVLSR